ncbi:unnamed protein product [Dovyalis caffra]|uniref:Uncharacterized protein n=1 Tax=Dovyalis caffra TaxID=77055 RepID=A0AAV1QMU2_9ROSI|nr:unnamed protein product [Dovyalis caffra]
MAVTCYEPIGNYAGTRVPTRNCGPSLGMECTFGLQCLDDWTSSDSREVVTGDDRRFRKWRCKSEESRLELRNGVEIENPR